MTLSAAILAGGRARRFGGRDKGALRVDGRSIRDRQIAELTTLTSDILIVGGPDGRPDRIPGCGPMGGLYTALVESQGDRTIVIACDMPYVTAAMLRHLCTLSGNVDAVVPYTDRGYHPLCAVYARACLEPATRRLAAGHLKMTNLLDDLRVRAVTAEELHAFGDPHRLLANVNTPADHRELDAFQGHQL